MRLAHYPTGVRLCVVLLLVVTLLSGPVGCSLFVGSNQTVRIEASDPEARLFVDGQQVGTGSAVVPLRRNKTHSVRAESPDGQVAQARIRKEISTTGILDIIGGIFLLVPFLGALAPGFWHLDPDYLFLKITPEEAPKTASSGE